MKVNNYKDALAKYFLVTLLLILVQYLILYTILGMSSSDALVATGFVVGLFIPFVSVMFGIKYATKPNKISYFKPIKVLIVLLNTIMFLITFISFGMNEVTFHILYFVISFTPLYMFSLNIEKYMVEENEKKKIKKSKKKKN